MNETEGRSGVRLTKGMKVRITTERLGVLDPNADPVRFADGIYAERGDEAHYAEPGTVPPWHHLTIEREGVIYICPAHTSQFTVVS